MLGLEKFQDLYITAKGEKRAHVPLVKLQTLWFNTGTQCNLSCKNCYIESNPTNDRLVYIAANDVRPYLEEIKADKLTTELIAFTGGEPFINPNMIEILDLTLGYGHEALVLTNAFNILKRHHGNLIELKSTYGDRLKLRISLDHYTSEVHDKERGVGTFNKTLEELKWLFDEGFNISIAGRSLIGEDRDKAMKGYQDLMSAKEIHIKLKEDNKIVIFPEMIPSEDVPEISIGCWDILGKKPNEQMCATERMVVKRKGSSNPVVLACTLLAYDKNFEMGQSLKEASQKVYLNHSFCSKFCVLGGSSCSSTN